MSGPDLGIKMVKPVDDHRLKIATDEAIRLAQETSKLHIKEAEKQNELDIQYENEKPPAPAPVMPGSPSRKKATKKVVKKPTSTKKTSKKPPGESGKGRPPGVRDTTKRKQRTLKRPNKT